MFLFDSGVFELMFGLVFILILGSIIINLVYGIGTWHKNNESPRLSVQAKVVTKRMDVHYHQNANGGDLSGAQGFSTTSDTTYYVTFEVESGDRMEFSVTGTEYGQLVEGDVGKLTFQGTRYLSFE